MKVHYSTPEEKEYYFHEGCHILELCNHQEQESLSIARARVEANQETQLHSLRGTVERYVILSGTGIATIGKNSYKVKPNDVLIINENVPQKIYNNGVEDLLFLVICSPRFIDSNYQLEK